MPSDMSKEACIARAKQRLLHVKEEIITSLETESMQADDDFPFAPALLRDHETDYSKFICEAGILDYALSSLGEIETAENAAERLDAGYVASRIRNDRRCAMIVRDVLSVLDEEVQ